MIHRLHKALTACGLTPEEAVAFGGTVAEPGAPSDCEHCRLVDAGFERKLADYWLAREMTE